MIIPVASRLGDVKEYYFSTKLKEIAAMRAAGKEVINLGIGSPDLPPPISALGSLSQHAQRKDIHAYQSYSGLPELRAAFANWYQRYFKVVLNPTTEVLPLIGSKEGIMHISMTFLEAGDTVLVPNPGYPAYSAVANLTGANIAYYNLRAENNWYPNLSEIEDSMDLSAVKIMWVNYPNMPTGTPANKGLFENLVAFAHKHQILICNDNPYSFILNNDYQSILAVDGAKEVALELNSLSKSHNMAGWRIGMLAGAQDYLSTILRFKSNMDSGMFKATQLAAIEALNMGPTWFDSINTTYKERREKVFQLLDLLDCTYDINQVGMFVWAAIPTTYFSGYELSDHVLYNSNVFITPGGIFGNNGDKYVRVSLCSSVESLELAIQRITINKLTTL